MKKYKRILSEHNNYIYIDILQKNVKKFFFICLDFFLKIWILIIYGLICFRLTNSKTYPVITYNYYFDILLKIGLLIIYGIICFQFKKNITTECKTNCYICLEILLNIWTLVIYGISYILLQNY